MLWPQISLVMLIYILIAIIPGKNIYSITLSVLIPILLYKIYTKKPSLSDWAKTILITICVTIGFYILLAFLGGFGLVGFIIIIIGLVVWRIIKGWKLYNYTTKWAADKLHGNKEEFDIGMLEPEKININKFP